MLISRRILYPGTEFHERRSKVESNEIASRVPNRNFRLWSKHRYACTRYTATIDEDVPRAKVTVVVIAIVSPCRVRNFRVQRPRSKMNEFESSQGVTRQIDAIERYAAKQNSSSYSCQLSSSSFYDRAGHSRRFIGPN